MFQRLLTIWVPRWLFWITVFAAGVLVLAVVLCPIIDDASAQSQPWRKIVAVCARDISFRRIAIASAAALFVTAFVFFRPSEDSRTVAAKQQGLLSSDSDADS
jgi:hypothetical protein